MSFSLTNYYKKDSAVEKLSVLEYLFQETHESAVILVRLKNYLKEEVIAVHNLQRSKIMLKWERNGSRSVLHLVVEPGQGRSVANIEFVMRVGFVAILLRKCPQ